ncbi:MAG: TlpA family protein disulfide reductase [Myxococcaceae bacterium]
MSEGSKSPWVSRILTGLLVFGILATGVYEGRKGSLLNDKPAPDFTAQKLGGGTLSLSELRGKVVLLDFWATWCPPCREEMPYLVKVAKELESQGVVLVAASRDEPESAERMVRLFISRMLPPLGEHTVVFARGDMARAYHVEALPTLYLIDRNGTVVDGARGQLSESQLRGKLEKVLSP